MILLDDTVSIADVLLFNTPESLARKLIKRNENSLTCVKDYVVSQSMYYSSTSIFCKYKYDLYVLVHQNFTVPALLIVFAY